MTNLLGLQLELRCAGMGGGHGRVDEGGPMRDIVPLTESIGYDAGVASITATLRKALKQCGKSRYRVSKDTGIPASTLSRFATTKKPLRGETMDTLCTYLGLILTKNAAGSRKEK